MIPQKVKDHLEEYISQEVYVQISVIKGKEKVSTKSAINKYLNSNHFKRLSLRAGLITTLLMVLEINVWEN